MFASILLCIHWQHREYLQRQVRVENWSDVLPAIQEVLPETDKVVDSSTTEADVEAAAEVRDANGQVIARVLRTSPAANHLLGFSGPTDVLLVMNPDSELIAAKIVSSRDTRDHVQKVLDDERFLQSLVGRSQQELLNLQDVDAVSGATLTSYAILESIRYRVSKLSTNGAGPSRLTSLKFPEPPRLEDVRLLYQNVAKVEPDANSTVVWKVLDPDGAEMGKLLRASPAADNNVGYQGPTDVLIAVDDQVAVTSIAVGVSYDNEPYVGYVREDEYFRDLFNGRDQSSLATIDGNTVEGVSGATMTSQSVARSLQLTAQAFVDEQKAREAEAQKERSTSAESSNGVLIGRDVISLRVVSTIVITLCGVVLGLTHLRGRRWLRISYQVVVICWLGLMNGDMVSQALLLGWAQSGIPWQNALGLSLLTVAAFLVPISTGRNVYCAQICPHGAVQQLVRRRLPWQAKLSPRILAGLRYLPLLLIVWAMAIGLLHLPFSPVDIEPFDAWLWSIAGAATIVVAVAGLVASLFVPMAYCRFGCPTGAVLDYIGGGGKNRNHRDTFVLVLVFAAIFVSVLC
jgi:NosR/NirI family transcriptional regulator, nitrous oxide reductase regulator